jgi:hypothetical protein
MRRSFTWTLLCVLMLIAVPLVTQLAVPSGVARAEPSAPATIHHDEVVTLTPGGQIVVNDVFPQPGMKPADWNSGSDAGWEYIAAGDFRGDGHEEIVAIKGSQLKVFDPFPLSGQTPVTFDRTPSYGGYYERIAVGDFNRDGKDDIAATAYTYNPSYACYLYVYNVSANTDLRAPEYFAATWQAMTTGDFNNDGASDLAMVRNPAGSSPFLKVYSGYDWSTIREDSFSFPWITLESGRLSSANLPDQLALLRVEASATYDSLIMFNVNSSGFYDVFPDKNGYWRYAPNFTSLALAAMSGTPQDVIYILRDPVYANSVGLVMVNPAGVPVAGHEIVLEAGYYSWHQVRAGDLNGDSRDEIVILRADRFRVYPQLWKSISDGGETFFDVTGSYRIQPTGTDWPVMVLANLDGPGVPAGPTLNVTPASLSYDLEFGATSPVKPLNISNTGTGSSFPWKAEVIAGGSWLQIDATSGATPGQVNVTVKTNVSPNTYNGTIRISSTDSSVQNNPVDVAVSYTLTAGQGLLVSPQTLDFQVPWGDPGPQQAVSIGGSGPTAWTAEVLEGGSWLNLGATGGTTPSTLYVSVSSTAAGVGVHPGTIKIAAVDPNTPNPIQYVSVSLTVPDPGFVIFPPQLTLWQQIGPPAIAITHEIQIVRPSAPTDWVATALPLTAAAGLSEKLASGQAKVTANGVVIDGVQVAPPTWLYFTPDHGTTYSVMKVKAQASTPGRYRAVIVIAAQDPTVTNPVQTIMVDAVAATHISINFLPLMLR